MSFILDALKKAESERQRASGPVLVDVRIAPPRRRLPAWVWVLGGMLLANLAVLSWVMLRKPVAPVVTAAVATSAPAAAAAPVTGPIMLPMPASAVREPAHAESLDPLILQTAPMLESPAVPGSAARSVNTTGLHTAQELRAAGVSLPPLVLNLHSWDTTPAQRFIMLNNLSLTEGQSTPDGIKVEAITEEGVVLQASGQRFLLPRGG